PLLDKVRRIFLESIGQYVRGRNTFTAPYARLTGFDQKVLGQVSGEYSFPMGLDFKMICHQFERAGITVPDPSSSLRDVLGVPD
ncbi:MAG: hypothetical protein JRN20_22680, partial [Nitrososphaerota archaeon]|nr:hypothetical protein [Nitrososphaerota archaeon]